MLLKETLFLWAWSFFKVPLIWLTRVSVVEANDRRCVVRIPFSRRNRNHLRSMYFGVLSVGADVAGALIAMRMIRRENAGVSLIFKDFKADFLKRAEGDVFFSCDDGDEIRQLVRRAVETGEREHMTVRVAARVPSMLGDEPVAQFELTLSLKRKVA